MATLETPGTVEEARGLVEAHVQARQPFAIRGAGTRAKTTRLPLLSTQKLCGTRFFHPDDMVVGVEAGMSCKQFRSLLASKGMFLPINPWFEGATIGGVVAANDFGPDRMDRGGIRDYLIGIEYIDGLGRRIRAGGKVVKNVTGYDLARMMVGSLGGLGLVTALHFKVMPAPVQPHAVLLRFDHHRWLTTFNQEVFQKQIPLNWMQAVYQEGAWLVGMGISGNDRRRERIVAELKRAFGELAAVPEDETPGRFSVFHPAFRYGGFLSSFTRAEQAELHIHGIYPSKAFLEGEGPWRLLGETQAVAVLHPVGGDLHLFWDRGEKEIIRSVVACFSGNKGHLVLEKARAEWLDALGWVIPKPAAYKLMCRLKHQLDPHGIFHAPFYSMVEDGP